jgi:hypothetical protein
MGFLYVYAGLAKMLWRSILMEEKGELYKSMSKETQPLSEHIRLKSCKNLVLSTEAWQHLVLKTSDIR